MTPKGIHIVLGRDQDRFWYVHHAELVDLLMFNKSPSRIQQLGIKQDEQTMASIGVLVAARIRRGQKWTRNECRGKTGEGIKNVPLVVEVNNAETMFAALNHQDDKGTEFEKHLGFQSRLLPPRGGKLRKKKQEQFDTPLFLGVNPEAFEPENIKIWEIADDRIEQLDSEDKLRKLFLELQVENKVSVALDKANGKTSPAQPRFPSLGPGEWVVPDAAGTRFLRLVRGLSVLLMKRSHRPSVQDIVLTLYGRPYKTEVGVGTFQYDLFYFSNVEKREVMYGPLVRNDERSKIIQEGGESQPRKISELKFKKAVRKAGGFVARERILRQTEIRLESSGELRGVIFVNLRFDVEDALISEEDNKLLKDIDDIVGEICAARLLKHNDRCGRFLNVLDAHKTLSETPFSNRLLDFESLLKDVGEYNNLQITAYVPMGPRDGGEFYKTIIENGQQISHPERLRELPESVKAVKFDTNHKPIFRERSDSSKTEVIVPILANEGSTFLGALEIHSSSTQILDSDDVQLFVTLANMALPQAFRRMREDGGDIPLSIRQAAEGVHTYLVTGFAGAFGVSLVSELFDRKINVIGVDNFSSETMPSEEKWEMFRALEKKAGDSRVGFAFYRTDVRNGALHKILARHRPTVVIHAAALVQDRESVERSLEFFDVNARGTANLLDAIRASQSVELLVLTGSRSATGEVRDSKTEMEETAAPKPVNPYGATKVAQEALCHAAFKNHHPRLNVTILRFNPLICLRVDMMTRRLLTALHLEKSFTKFGTGNGSRDWLHIDDAVEAVLEAITNPKIPRDFNTFLIGSGKATTLNELIEVATRVVAKGPPRFIKLDPPKGDALHGGIGKSTEFKTTTNWTPKGTLEDGLKDLYHRLKENGFWPKQVKLGVAGAGGAFTMKAHGPAILAELGINLTGVCSSSRSRTKAQGFAKEFGATSSPPIVVSDLDELVRLPDVEAIDIVVPTPLMAGAITKALSAKKHVLSEKPIAANSGEARKLIEVWQAMDPQPIWLVLENWRFEESFILARQQLEAGNIGQIKTVRCKCVATRKADSPYVTSQWRKATHGKCAWLEDVGTHAVAALKLVFGKITHSGGGVRSTRTEGQIEYRETVSTKVKVTKEIEANLEFLYEINNQKEDVFDVIIEIVGAEGTLVVNRKRMQICGRDERRQITREFQCSTVNRSLALFVQTIQSSVPVDKENPLHPEFALSDLEILESIRNSLGKIQGATNK